MSKTDKLSMAPAGNLGRPLGQVVEPAIAREVRLALKLSLQASGRSVDQIAEDMGERLNRRITADMIYAWIAESNSNRFPYEFAPAWIRATGGWNLLHVLADALGLPHQDGRDADLLAYGRHALERDINESEMEALRARILKHGGAHG